MGSTIKAKCGCGFDSGSLSFGGGFDDVGGKCLASALSRQTGMLVVRDYWETQNPARPSKQFIFYNNPELQEQMSGDEKNSEFSLNEILWNGNSETHPSFYLPDINYLCPNCGEIKMRFKDIGLMWD